MRGLVDIGGYKCCMDRTDTPPENTVGRHAAKPRKSNSALRGASHARLHHTRKQCASHSALHYAPLGYRYVGVKLNLGTALGTALFSFLSLMCLPQHLRILWFYERTSKSIALSAAHDVYPASLLPPTFPGQRP